MLDMGFEQDIFEIQKHLEDVPERIENKAILIKGEEQMFKHIQTYIEQNRDKKIIIFTETKQTAKDFEKLTFAQFLTLHGDLEQNQRETRLNRYRDKNSKYILVATDVAARGLALCIVPGEPAVLARKAPMFFSLRVTNSSLSWTSNSSLTSKLTS